MRTIVMPLIIAAFAWRPPGRLRRFGSLIIAALLCGILMPLIAAAGNVKLGGTGSALGTMQLLVKAFKQSDPQFSLIVMPNLGTTGGMKALAAGAIDIAVTNRPPKGEEVTQGLVASLYGQTPFVMVTSKAGVSAITVPQLVQIYAGKQSTWPDGSPIRLVLRPANDGDTSLLAGFSADMKQALDMAMAKEGMIVALTDQDSINTIERLPGALGTTSLALLLSERRPLTPLAINGVQPSIEAITDGSYPYMKSMYLVTKGQPTGAVARFMQFVFSPAGQVILRATGHWNGGAKRAAN